MPINLKTSVETALVGGVFSFGMIYYGVPIQVTLVLCVAFAILITTLNGMISEEVYTKYG